jgi:hypothetical protein
MEERMKATNTLSGMQTGCGLRGFIGTRVKRMMGLKMHGASISSEESLTFSSICNNFGKTPGMKPGKSEHKKICVKEPRRLGRQQAPGFRGFLFGPLRTCQEGKFSPSGKVSSRALRPETA